MARWFPTLAGQNAFVDSLIKEAKEPRAQMLELGELPSRASVPSRTRS